MGITAEASHARAVRARLVWNTAPSQAGSRQGRAGHSRINSWTRAPQVGRLAAGSHVLFAASRSLGAHPGCAGGSPCQQVRVGADVCLHDAHVAEGMHHTPDSSRLAASSCESARHLYGHLSERSAGIRDGLTLPADSGMAVCTAPFPAHAAGQPQCLTYQLGAHAVPAGRGSLPTPTPTNQLLQLSG